MSGAPMRVASWNIAAINNNPFEYWITYEDESYNVLMDKLQQFLTADKLAFDEPIEKVFKPEFFGTLKTKLVNSGLLKESEAAAFTTCWDEVKVKKCVSEFFTDGTIGKKRLTSMPDRTTNTVATTAGGICRPTAINCYSENFDNIDDWFDKWISFMFDTKLETSKGEKLAFQLLQPIKKSKYPAITEVEESISEPLSCLYLALFDCVLITLLDTISNENKIDWQNIRKNIASSLNSNKNGKTIDILKNSYADCDIIFLQEVGNVFADSLKADPVLGAKFNVFIAKNSGKRDQNSVVLTSKVVFDKPAVDVTDDVLAKIKLDNKNVPIAEGDLVCITSGDTLFASFHGDTNGLATIPVMAGVLKYVEASDTLKKGISGIDANTYFKTKKPDQFQDMEKFIAWFQEHGLSSCYGYNTGAPIENNVTTYNGRTYLQPQLNKAIGQGDILTKGDVNQKDFILFGSSIKLESKMEKDNTGKQTYVDGIVYPTLDFPSDHAVISCKVSFL